MGPVIDGVLEEEHRVEPLPDEAAVVIGEGHQHRVDLAGGHRLPQLFDVHVFLRRPPAPALQIACDEGATLGLVIATRDRGGVCRSTRENRRAMAEAQRCIVRFEILSAGPDVAGWGG